MNKQELILIAIGLLMLTSCKQNNNSRMSDVEVWKLGWRMVSSSIEENYERASLQFDSLRINTIVTDRKHLLTGLQAKNELGKFDEITVIVDSLDKGTLQDICQTNLLSGYKMCEGYLPEAVGNKELQLELIKMYVDDQAVRGNLMESIITKYSIDSTEIHRNGAIAIDESNRNRLKEIFSMHGFPTKELVGKDAMQGIFFIIQHSDEDKEWQKSQLINIENAVKRGDMEGERYAYLYDRIKVNSGKKQLYGTQFSNVDLASQTVELAAIEDPENLDKRRMEIGLMPIRMYKEFMLKNL